MTYFTDSGFATMIQKPSFVARVKRALELRKQRVTLAGLTNEQLTDIGLTRREVEEERAKSLW
jgi:uncharacterized protein YjiS (DUF1127 family)